MPPKKKDDKKKEEPPNNADEERELVEKELVIGYLRSKLGRYQDHGDRLQVDNMKLAEELETQKLNLRDINEFLTNELKARSLTTTALEAKVQELNNLMEEVKKNHEAALVRLRADKDKDIERLEAVLREHDRKARITQEFLERKDSMEAELAGLKEALARTLKEHEEKLTDLDRQHIQDREKWKRETAQRIKETKLQMMKLTDNQLEMTTKRTIMENEQMSIELSYQSRQTEKLLSKNTRLVEENAELRRQMELSKQTEQELAKRNNLYQKTIKTLLAKLKDQGWAQQEAGEVVGTLEDRLQDLEQQLHLAQLQLEEKEHNLERVSSSLDAKSSELERLSGSQDAASRFLLACLADVRDKVVTVVREERPGQEGDAADITLVSGRLEELSAEQRERVLAWLLEKLNGWQVARQQAGDFTAAAGLFSPAGGRAGAGAGDAGASGGITLPPIPSFNRRQYTSHAQPLSQSASAPPSAQPGSGDWGGGGGGGVPSSRAGGSRLGPSRDAGGSAGLAGVGVLEGPAGSGVPMMSDGMAPTFSGYAMVPSAQGHMPLGTGMGMPPGAVPVGALQGAFTPDLSAAAASALPGGVAVDEALSKVMGEVRPWGRKAETAALSTKHASYLKRGQAKAAVKV